VTDRSDCRMKPRQCVGIMVTASCKSVRQPISDSGSPIRESWDFYVPFENKST
jgi:hypothetical protein